MWLWMFNFEEGLFRFCVEQLRNNLECFYNVQIHTKQNGDFGVIIAVALRL